jgi:hypothetical protein
MVIAWPMNARWVAGVWVRGPLGAEVGMTASGCVFWPVAVGHDLYGHVAAPVINDKAGGMRSAVRINLSASRDRDEAPHSDETLCRIVGRLAARAIAAEPRDRHNESKIEPRVAIQRI